MMTLIVEDGTIVTGANTYNLLPAVQFYAENRNRVISDDDVLISGYMIRAMDYLESFRPRYKGTLTDPDQPLAFPRTGLTINGVAIDSNVIPLLVIAAQCQLVIDLDAGIELQPSYVRSNQIVKRRRAGPVEVEFFEGGQLFTNPQLTAFDNMIAPLLMSDTQDIRRTLRI